MWQEWRKGYWLADSLADQRVIDLSFTSRRAAINAGGAHVDG